MPELDEFFPFIGAIIGNIKLVSSNNKKQRAVLFQSIEVLTQIFQNNEVSNKLGEYLNDLLPFLAEKLLTSSFEGHFELISSFFRVYKA